VLGWVYGVPLGAVKGISEVAVDQLSELEAAKGPPQSTPSIVWSTGKFSPPILWELRPDSRSPYSADEVTLLGSASTPESTHRFPACTTGR
jgi:hypothetical protein